VTRAELLKELDRIIDVGIVNAHHDKDVLRKVRDQLAGPVYVVTAGSYSDYHVECVSFDLEKAEQYKDLCYDGNDVDEYIPIEMQNEETVSENLSYIDVEWNRRTDTIEKVQSTYYPHKVDNMWGDVFKFSVLYSSRVGADIAEYGKDSALAKKIAQDRYAAWTEKDMELHPERYTVFSGKFVVTPGAILPAKED
jgi:hypothetical protein